MKRLLAVAGVLLAVALPAAGAEATTKSSASLATYHGRTIDLSTSWEGAQACWIDESANECYDSYDEMVEQHPELTRPVEADEASTATSGGPVLYASCSSAVQLFDGTGFGGTSIALVSRGSWLNLSTWGFAGRTSSYAIGACNSALADGSSTYPGPTGAWATASSMSSGWDNRVTRVLIY